jgi:methylglyoxal synthase
LAFPQFKGAIFMTIAILAHDSRKELMLQFCTAYAAILSKHNLIATGTTGRLLSQATGLPVHCCLAGALGGNQQITAHVACDEVDLVLFFRDPLEGSSNLNDQTLMRLCDMHNVPLATNTATAEILLRGIEYGDLDYRANLHHEMGHTIPMPTNPTPRVVC